MERATRMKDSDSLSGRCGSENVDMSSKMHVKIMHAVCERVLSKMFNSLKLERSLKDIYIIT